MVFSVVGYTLLLLASIGLQSMLLLYVWLLPLLLGTAGTHGAVVGSRRGLRAGTTGQHPVNTQELLVNMQELLNNEREAQCK